MSRIRTCLISLTVGALVLAVWSGWEVRRVQRDRGQEWSLMLPGDIPALQPLAPADEVERQILDLLYEPLVRLNSEGKLSPALAQDWAWHERVSCWFADTETLRRAQTRVAEFSPGERTAWELTEVTAQGRELTLHFARPGGSGVEAVLRQLAEFKPLPLTFLRLSLAAAARPALEAFAAHADHADTTLRLWFDDDGSCELVTTRTSLQAQQALATWLRARNLTVPAITPLAEVTALAEPVLDFHLHESRGRWPDGTAVSAADVRATLDQVRRLGLPLPEGFRHIQNLESPTPDRLRVIYRRNYGAAIASWVGFPIFRAGTLEDGSQPPPNGAWRVVSRAARRLTLEPVQVDAGLPSRLHFLAAAPPLSVRVGLATQSLDLIWPNPVNDRALRKEPSLDFYPTPAKHRLLLLWNTRSPRVADAAVRAALARAVDRQALLTEVLDGRGRPAVGLFPPDVWFSRFRPVAPADEEAAVRDLAAAGWLKDVEGVLRNGEQALEFELLVPEGNVQRERLARMLEQQWASLGVHVTVTAVAPQALVPDRLARGRFDAVLLGLNDELNWDLSSFWHSREVNGGLNFSGVADPQLDLLLEALEREFDSAQVPARALAVEERVLALQPVLPLLHDLQPVALRRERFAEVAKNIPRRGLTLRDLLMPAVAPPVGLRMMVPEE